MPPSSTEASGPAARRGATNERERRNRADLGAQVRQLWVQGALRHSLHERLGRDLAIPGPPGSPGGPSRALAALPGQAPAPRERFAAGGGRLLILGAPGSGKTTALLALAEALLDDAGADAGLPIPVIFPLSTWAARRPPLDAWLVAELAQGYKVPAPLGRAWVDGGFILPLLDGLDEVGATDAERSACAEAIEAYLRLRGGPVVVCAQDAPLARHAPQLQAAARVELGPLTAAQVERRLARLGPPLAGLRAALPQDGALRDMAASPLLLDVMALAYRDLPAGELVGRGGADPERRLWTDFVARRLAAPLAGASSDPEQLRAWLIWLARGMSAHSQEIFRVEYLGPGWLATRRQRRLFGWAGALGFGLVAFALGATLSGLLGGLLGTLAAGLVLLLAGVLGGGLVAGLRSDGGGRALRGGAAWTWRHLYERSRVRDALRATLVAILTVAGAGAALAALLRLGIGGELDPLLGRIASEPRSAGAIAVVILMIALLGGGLLDAARQAGELLVDVEPEDGLRRSRRGMITGGLQRGLTFGLFAGLLIGLRGGLGIGLLVGLAAGLLGLLLGGLISRVFADLSGGSSALWKHAVLRWMLHRYSGAPRSFAAPLDEAVGRGLLVPVGGGYRFAHRRLQEHFAEHERSALPVAPILGPERRG